MTLKYPLPRNLGFGRRWTLALCLFFGLSAVTFGQIGQITVNAGPDQTITLPNNTATLNGSADGGGVPLTYTWSEVSGPSGATVSFADPSNPQTTATFSTGGVYTLQLAATDGIRTGQSTVNITVNQPPVVNAGPAQTIELPSNANMSGTASDDGLPNPPGALTYSWTMVSGPGTATFSNSTALSTTASFSTAGTYTLQLAAFDGSATSTSTVVITVYPVNQAPIVTVGPAQAIALSD